MRVVLGIVAIVLSLLLVVGLHEAGHAVMARLFKVKIKKISIGFGRSLFSWQGKSGSEWVWAMWPLGGYVQLLNSRIEPVPLSQDKFCFDKKSVWARGVILLAGAFANISIAWIALVLMYTLGYQQTSPVIETVVTPSVVASAGLAAGDRMVSIDGETVASWRAVGMRLIMTMGKSKVDVGVENETGVARHLTLDLSQWRYNRKNMSLLSAIGINPDLSPTNTHDVTPLPLLTACYHSILQLIDLVGFFCIMLKQLFTGVIPFAALLGPLGLFSTMIDSFHQGLAMFLYFIANLSLAVAFINLFPIPGLDGGSIVYALVEKIRGKPVSVGMEVLLHRLVFIAFCLILVQLLLNDVQRYTSYG